MFIHMVILAHARYSVQILPFAAIFVAISLQGLWARIEARRQQSAPVHEEVVEPQ